MDKEGLYATFSAEYIEKVGDILTRKDLTLSSFQSILRR